MEYDGYELWTEQISGAASALLCWVPSTTEGLPCMCAPGFKEAAIPLPSCPADFIRDVIGGDERVVLVGNSLGGYNALETAARQPDLVRWVVECS